MAPPARNAADRVTSPVTYTQSVCSQSEGSMQENAVFTFSHYAPAGGCVCWYCRSEGAGFARFLVGSYRASYYAPVSNIVAEVCSDCEHKAREGERGED